MKGLQRKRGGRATGSVAKKAGNLMFLVLMIVALSAVFAMPAMAEDCGCDISVSFADDKEHSLDSEIFLYQIYDWSFDKKAIQDKVMVKRGESATIDYRLTATRTLVGEGYDVFVYGSVLVQNESETVTGLEIDVRVDDSSDNDVSGPWPVVILEDAANGSNYYDFMIYFEAQELDDYKVVIDRAEANLCGEIAGVGSSMNLNLPEQPTDTYAIDDVAHITDVITLISGFTFTYQDGINNWLITDSDVIEYSVTVTNNSAEHDKCFDLTNTATLTMGMSEDEDGNEIMSRSISGKNIDDDFDGVITDSATVKICTPKEEVPAPVQVTTKKAATLPHTGMNDVALLISIVLGVIGVAFLVLSYTSFGKKLMVLGSKVE